MHSPDQQHAAQPPEHSLHRAIQPTVAPDHHAQDTHPHEHDDHEHNHDEHNHDEHEHAGSWGWLSTILHSHSHDHSSLAPDQSFLDNQEAIRVVWIALGLLLLTTLLQLVIFSLSGSVALLADTAHNLVDGLNSLPLLMAFYLARRAPTRR